MSVRYEPGDGVAVIGRGGVAIIAADRDHRIVDIIAPLLADRAIGVAAVADGLASIGVGALPDFALLLYGEQQRTVLVRGGIRVDVGWGDDAETINMVPVATWIEQPIENTPVLLAIKGVSAPTGRFWMDAGVTPAGAVQIGETTLAPDSSEHGRDLLSQSSDASDSSRANSQEHAGQERNQEGVESTRGSATSDDSQVAEFDFTHMVDHTVYRDARDAEVLIGHTDTPEASLKSEELSGEPEENDSTSVIPSIEMSPTIPPEVTNRPPELIRSVPFAGIEGLVAEASDAPGTDSLEPVKADAAKGDHDGHTIVRGRGRSSMGESLPADDSSARMVNGVLCPQGHSNSPVVERCMQCASTLPDRRIRPVRRPVLARLRMPSGDVHDIAGPIVVGRQPVATELIDGEVPAMLTIDDEAVTRNHAQIMIDDWNILIVDLESTNQTVIALPGQVPRIIAPHDPCIIVPGTEIDFGGFGPVIVEDLI